MVAYDIQLLWAELHRMEKEKANVCPVKDMSKRIDVLETAVNDIIQRVERIELNAGDQS
jgi:hypothetical protein